MELSAVCSSDCINFLSVIVVFCTIVSSFNLISSFSGIISLWYRLPIKGKWGAIALGSKKSAGETLRGNNIF